MHPQLTQHVVVASQTLFSEKKQKQALRSGAVRGLGAVTGTASQDGSEACVQRSPGPLLREMNLPCFADRFWRRKAQKHLRDAVGAPFLLRGFS